WRVQVARRHSLVHRVPDASMSEIQLVRLAKRVLNPRNLQIPRVIVRERHDVEAQRLQGTERSRRREPAPVWPRLRRARIRLTWFRDHCFKVGEFDVAFQKSSDL